METKNILENLVFKNKCYISKEMYSNDLYLICVKGTDNEKYPHGVPVLKLNLQA